MQKKLLAKLEKLKIRSEIINECTLIIYILYKHVLHDIKNPQEFCENFSVCYFNQCSWHKYWVMKRWLISARMHHPCEQIEFLRELDALEDEQRKWSEILLYTLHDSMLRNYLRTCALNWSVEKKIENHDGAWQPWTTKSLVHDANCEYRLMRLENLLTEVF